MAENINHTSDFTDPVKEGERRRRVTAARRRIEDALELFASELCVTDRATFYALVLHSIRTDWYVINEEWTRP